MASHPKGSVEINGVWYSPALQTLMQGAGQWPPGGAAATSTAGTGKMVLPDRGVLEAAAAKLGIKLTAAQLKFAGKPIRMTAGSSGFPSAADFVSAIDSLATDPKYGSGLSRVVAEAVGLNDRALGKDISQRADSIIKYYPVSGDLSQLNPAQMAAYGMTSSSLKAVTKALGVTEAALSSGNQAALIGATASAKYSAEANADSDLTNWGIDTHEMNSLVTKLVQSGVTNTNEILQNIRATSTYKHAFAGLAEYNAVAGHVHMTESEYRTYSQFVQGAAQQYGNVTMNQNMIGTLLKGGVTAPEFNQRVQDIAATINNLDPNAKSLLQKEFGVNPEHLFAYYANPKEALPDMQRAVDTASIQDYASRVGLGGLTFGGAKQLGDMAKAASTAGNQPLGYGVSNIENSLLTASKDAPLLHSLPGAATTGINTTALIGSQLAGFGGTKQPADQVAVQRAEDVKAAPFEKGGGAEQTDRGVIGLGSART